MTQGISIHIGLNRIDTGSYGTDGLLAGCENDAHAMQEIADSLGYSSHLLLTSQATSAQVVQEIGKAAKVLDAGDILLLTYSGHGGQLPDANGDEEDGYDETWCLYDRMLVDDELFQLWSQFKNNVRIVVLSDSCHSGTVLKMLFKESTTLSGASTLAMHPPSKAVFVSMQDNYSSLFNGNGGLHAVRSVGPEPYKYKALTPSECMTAYAMKKDLYDTMQWMVPRGSATPIGASVLLISGCQDNQLSMDGNTNGLFTEKLLEVWDGGNFAGDYRKLHTEICRRMPPTQTPNFFTVGTTDSSFECARAFEIATASRVQEVLSVKGPSLWSKSATPPLFSIVTGPNKFYIFEITTEPKLFDYSSGGAERSASNFYGSYADNPRFNSPTYNLPPSVWATLSQASDKLYYRIGTTTSKDESEGWNNYQVSTPDNLGDRAPFVAVV